jgi:hypothetical protein
MHARDFSILPLMVEELISQGAIHLAIPRSSLYYKAIDNYLSNNVGTILAARV